MSLGWVGDTVPAVGRVLAQVPADVRRQVGQVVDLRGAGLVAEPPRWLLTALRRARPRLRLPGKPVEIRTGGADVEATLRDDQAYTVAPYAAQIDLWIGPFALGLDGPAHRAARARIDDALDGIDLAELATWADRLAAGLVEVAREDGRLEVVGELAEPLATAFVSEWLGLPAPVVDPLRPDQGLAAWTRDAFEATFLNLAGDRVVHQRGARAAERLRELAADRLVADRAHAAAGEPVADTTLTRSAHVHDDTAAVADVVGLAVGAVPTVGEAVARVVKHLLEHPDRLAAARAAASAGEREEVWRHALEALRFDPQSPALLRAPACPVAGGPRALLVSTLSAMHDPGRVPEPGRYRTDRPDTAYLHFGMGPHRCPGAPLAKQLVVAALTAALGEPGLGMLDGPLGTVREDGPMVRAYWVSLTAAPS